MVRGLCSLYYHYCGETNASYESVFAAGKKEAAHVACTVEMTDIERDIEVAIIDEIQMLRDTQRGWAWLRAFLGKLRLSEEF